MFSVWPSDWGWKEVDMACLVPRRRHSSVVKWEVNLLSRSEMILRDSPCSYHTLATYRSANPSASSVSLVATKCTSLVSLQTKTTMAELLLGVRGRQVIRSVVKHSQGAVGIATGFRVPAGLWVEALLTWQ